MKDDKGPRNDARPSKSAIPTILVGEATVCVQVWEALVEDRE
jgi:hypothetical protein